MDYQKKYLKYKEKYLKYKNFLKFQYGGEKRIEYSEKLNKFVSAHIYNELDRENVKESIYSCIYMNMTLAKGACSPGVSNINCSVLEQLSFPVYTSDAADIAEYAIIDDKINNNLVIVFAPGSVLFCDHFVDKLFKIFIYIYEQIQTYLVKKEESEKYKYIHITGHSMGASIATLFSYFIMIVEKSTVGNMYIQSPKYFTPEYELKKIYNMSYIVDFFEKYFEIFKENDIIEYNRETNLDNIKKNLDVLLAKNYPKISSKISICVIGGFPVLFDKNDALNYISFVSHFGERYINFGNCYIGELTDDLLPNIGLNFCDDKLFNIILKENKDSPDIIKELTNFNYVDIDKFVYTDATNTRYKLLFTITDGTINKQSIPDITYLQRSTSSAIHQLKANYDKLKANVRVITL